MEFLQLMEQRYSVRKYAEKAVEEEKLNKVLQAALNAPTAKNNQPFRIYVLKSEEALAKIRGITRCAFNAPIVLLFTYQKEEQWENPLEAGVVSGVEDVAIVASHAMLEAADLGLGTCWVNFFPNTETEKAFCIPETERSVLLMPLGYASEDSAPTPNHTTKRPKEELVKEL